MTRAATPVPWTHLPGLERLHLPLQAPIGLEPRYSRGSLGFSRRLLQPVVSRGDRVLKGELIATGGLNLHASTSGTIAGIESLPMTEPGALQNDAECPHLLLEPDGEERWTERTAWRPEHPQSPAELIQQIKRSGVCGQGGAGYPTHLKLQAALDWKTSTGHLEALVVNAIECEPCMISDACLLQEDAPGVLGGVALLRQLLNPKHTFIAVSEPSDSAAESCQTRIQKSAHLALQRALDCATDEFHEQADSKGTLQLKQFPPRPALGHEPRLLQELGLGSPGIYPTEAGVLSLNVSTVYALWRALRHGEPLVERLVTWADDQGRCQTLMAPIGLPISVLFSDAPQDARIFLNGPLSGWRISIRASLNKAHMGVYRQNTNPTTYPCIRCGECHLACPVHLNPQQLHWVAGKNALQRSIDAGIANCIECGLCDSVCPSHLPLLEQFRLEKRRVEVLEYRRREADEAKVRFHAHQQRLARKAELLQSKRAQRLAARSRQSKQP